MIETTGKGAAHADEDKTAIKLEEEEAEAAEAEEATAEGGREEKARAGPPLFPASQPALSPKPCCLLDGAE